MDNSKIKDICNFDGGILAQLAKTDLWWLKAVAWYHQVLEVDFEELTEVQKHWVAQMKTKYNKVSNG